jgi:phage-related protein
MYSLTVERPDGEQLELTHNETEWQIAKISGIAPSDADITTKELANWDGAVYVDSRVESRSITIEIYLNNNVESNRIKLYQFFKPSKYVKLYFETNERNVYITGYTEKVDIDHFDKHQVMQISIECPSPFFRSVPEQETKLSNTLGGFYFPFAIDSVGIEFTTFESERKIAIYNYGEISTGARFVFTFTGDVENPTIYNRDTGEYIRIIKTFSRGEEVEVDTTKGNRGIKKINEETEENLISDLDINSTWLQLESGKSYFSLKADKGVDYLTVMIYNSTYYQGL